MKTVLILCVLSFVGSSLGESECEVGNHAYTPGCGFVVPEPTCADPTPETDTSFLICDFSACYCDPPTVKDEVTSKCIPLEECPK